MARKKSPPTKHASSQPSVKGVEPTFWAVHGPGLPPHDVFVDRVEGDIGILDATVRAVAAELMIHPQLVKASREELQDNLVGTERSAMISNMLLASRFSFPDSGTQPVDMGLQLLVHPVDKFFDSAKLDLLAWSDAIATPEVITGVLDDQPVILCSLEPRVAFHTKNSYAWQSQQFQPYVLKEMNSIVDRVTPLLPTEPIWVNASELFNGLKLRRPVVVELSLNEQFRALRCDNVGWKQIQHISGMIKPVCHNLRSGSLRTFNFSSTEVWPEGLQAIPFWGRNRSLLQLMLDHRDTLNPVLLTGGEYGPIEIFGSYHDRLIVSQIKPIFNESEDGQLDLQLSVHSVGGLGAVKVADYLNRLRRTHGENRIHIHHL